MKLPGSVDFEKDVLDDEIEVAERAERAKAFAAQKRAEATIGAPGPDDVPDVDPVGLDDEGFLAKKAKLIEVMRVVAEMEVAPYTMFLNEVKAQIAAGEPTDELVRRRDELQKKADEVVEIEASRIILMDNVTPQDIEGIDLSDPDEIDFDALVETVWARVEGTDLESGSALEAPAETQVEVGEKRRALLAAVANGDLKAPEHNPEYFNLPEGEAIEVSEEDLVINQIDRQNSEGSVRRGPSHEEFLKQMEAQKAAALEAQSQTDYPDWMKKPDIWPDFIRFPSKRDMARIRDAESRDVLTDELKEAFNDELQKQSELMQQRAAQVHLWIIDQTRSIEERMSPLRRLTDLQLKREKKVQAEYAKSLTQLDHDQDDPETEIDAPDPFYGIKWATLLDPDNKTTGSSNVARWGHDYCVMQDGGHIQADDNGMFVPTSRPATGMAGRFMVEEAFQRGWDTIVIEGNDAFCAEARKAAIELGMGAQITPRFGALGRGKTEFIMPKVPGLEASAEHGNDANDIEVLADRLDGEEGRVPEKGPKPEPKQEPKPEPTGGTQPKREQFAKVYDELAADDGTLDPRRPVRSQAEQDDVDQTPSL